MKKFSIVDIAALVVWILPIAYLWSIYSTMPATVPLHYGINGTIDKYGSKHELFSVQAILLFVSLLVYFLMKFLPYIDPKKQVKIGAATFQKLAFGLVFFFSALNLAIVYGATHQTFKLDKILLPIIGLLLAFIGNIMNSIKPNYFAGVRTPWTLESEDNWRATHRLAGKVWFVGGILLTIMILFIPTPAAKIVFLGSIAIMTFWPVIYSYVYFKQHQPK